MKLGDQEERERSGQVIGEKDDNEESKKPDRPRVLVCVFNSKLGTTTMASGSFGSTSTALGPAWSYTGSATSKTSPSRRASSSRTPSQSTSRASSAENNCHYCYCRFNETFSNAPFFFGTCSLDSACLESNQLGFGLGFSCCCCCCCC